MAVRVLAEQRRPRGPKASPTSTDVTSLMKIIIAEVKRSGTEPTLLEIDGDVQEVLLDVEVEGLRCVLVRPRPEDRRVAVILSPREQEIARMIAKGYPNKTIAAVLEISSWTVCTYLRRTFAKLGVGSRAAMVARLVEEGILKDKPGRAVPGFEQGERLPRMTPDR